MAKVKQHDIDLYRSYKAKIQHAAREKKQVAMKTGMIAFSIVMAAGLTACYMWQRTRLDEINVQVQDYDVLLSDPQMIADNTQMKILDRQKLELDELFSTLMGQRLKMALMENRFTYLKEDFFDNVYDCCTSDIEMVRYEVTGLYFIGEFETDSSLKVPDFVARLRDTGMFSTISYEGFNYSQEENAPIVYSFTVNCKFVTEVLTE